MNNKHQSRSGWRPVVRGFLVMEMFSVALCGSVWRCSVPALLP